MRVRSTSDAGKPKAHGQYFRDSGDLSHGPGQPATSRERKLNGFDRVKLSHLVQVTVAARTAKQLSQSLDTDIDGNPRFQQAITAVRDLAGQPGVRRDKILARLDAHLPWQTPMSIKVLVLEAVARQLGREWANDALSFVDVTIVAARLQDLANALANKARQQDLSTDGPFVAILLPHNEQHSLMGHLAGALFQSYGWQQQVLMHGRASKDEFVSVTEKSDAVCIAWGSTHLKHAVNDLILDIQTYRGASMPQIIAGGAAAVASDHYLMGLGVEQVCDSLRSAVKAVVNSCLSPD